MVLICGNFWGIKCREAFIYVIDLTIKLNVNSYFIHIKYCIDCSKINLKNGVATL
jgi:hypothetical protein